VVERAGGLGVAAEPLPQQGVGQDVGLGQLESDLAVGLGVVGQDDDAEPPPAEDLAQAEAPERALRAITWGARSR
jgi:hypothetical protein